MINNVVWLLWYEFIVDDIKLLNDNPVSENPIVSPVTKLGCSVMSREITA